MKMTGLEVVIFAVISTTDKKETIKRIHYKELLVTSIFWKFYISINTFYKELIRRTNYQMSIFVL